MPIPLQWISLSSKKNKRRANHIEPQRGNEEAAAVDWEKDNSVDFRARLFPSRVNSSMSRMDRDASTLSSCWSGISREGR